MTRQATESPRGGVLDGIIPSRPEVERYVRLIAPHGTVCTWEGPALRLAMPDADRHRERVLGALGIVYSALEVRA